MPLFLQCLYEQLLLQWRYSAKYGILFSKLVDHQRIIPDATHIQTGIPAMESGLSGDCGNRGYMITGYDFDLHILLTKILQCFFYMRTYGIGKDNGIQRMN